MSASVYRRRVLLAADAGTMTAELEDDHHRFGVTVTHDGGCVTGIVARSIRVPWTTCPSASKALDGFLGTSLLASPFAVLRQTTMRTHCTHMLDLTALAIAAAARGIVHRVYDAAFTRHVQGTVEQLDGTVTRDDSPAVHWLLDDTVIVAPSRYAGQELRRAASWIGEHTVDADEMEAVLIAQRAVLVASGLRFGTQPLPQTADGVPWLKGACFTFGLPELDGIRRLEGRTDFTDRPEDLLRDLAP